MNLEVNSDLVTLIPSPILVETKQEKPEVHLKALTFYQQELKKNLPEDIFKRAPSRALFLVSFLYLLHRSF